MTDTQKHDPDGAVSANLPAEHRSGFVAVIGRPNVGKSTLMNALLGEKLAIVTPKPQTTRGRQLGILTLPHAQIIFVDTPGMHRPRTLLGEYMVRAATESLPTADAILFLVDGSMPPTEDDRSVAARLGNRQSAPVILVLNKCDLLDPEMAEHRLIEYGSALQTAQILLASARRGDNVAAILELTVSFLPVGPRLYPEDQLTDIYVKDNAAEIIREKVLQLFEEEIPHAVAVQVDEFKERSQSMTYIAATIFVEKDSQKGILVGHKGQSLKKLGQLARPDLEDLIGTQVYLEMWVKVQKNWRKDARALKRLGYYHKA